MTAHEAYLRACREADALMAEEAVAAMSRRPLVRARFLVALAATWAFALFVALERAS